jgi:NAD(P)-dependent dehydrogenase (short-subunit alcohol dehydrogenase family)
MSKFALRALAQSAARELGPKGIRVAHFVIDGAGRSAGRRDPADNPDSTLDPDAIAQTYIDVLRQPRSAWSLEVEVVSKPARLYRRVGRSRPSELNFLISAGEGMRVLVRT